MRGFFESYQRRVGETRIPRWTTCLIGSCVFLRRSRTLKFKTQNSKFLLWQASLRAERKTQNSHRRFHPSRQRRGRLLLSRPDADTRHRQRALLPVVLPSCGEVRTARRSQRDIAHRDVESSRGSYLCRHAEGINGQGRRQESRRRSKGVVRCDLPRGAQRACRVETPTRRAHHQHRRWRHHRLCRPRTPDARVRFQGGRLRLRAWSVRNAWQHHRCLFLLVGAAVPHRLLRRRGRHHTHVRGSRSALEGREAAGAHRARTGAAHRGETAVHVATARRRAARDERPPVSLFYHRADIQRRLLAASHDRTFGGCYGGGAAADNARYAQGEQPRVAHALPRGDMPLPPRGVRRKAYGHTAGVHRVPHLAAAALPQELQSAHPDPRRLSLAGLPALHPRRLGEADAAPARYF